MLWPHSIAGPIPAAASNSAIQSAMASMLVVDMVEEARLAYPTIVYDLRIEGQALVMADSGRLGQVLSNLLSNARHHGEPNQPIGILLHCVNGQAEISIANAGAPIPHEIESGLFNPFKRSSLNNPRNRTGMGLGLYISRQIAERHGGRLWAASPGEGQGSTFSLWLPRVQAYGATSHPMTDA